MRSHDHCRARIVLAKAGDTDPDREGIAVGIGGLIIWGYVEGRGEAEREAERERPIKEPLRVSTKNGMPVVTLDNGTQQNSGIESTRLETGVWPRLFPAQCR
jgi:hypothetical protein